MRKIVSTIEGEAVGVATAVIRFVKDSDCTIWAVNKEDTTMMKLLRMSDKCGWFPINSTMVSPIFMFNTVQEAVENELKDSTLYLIDDEDYEEIESFIIETLKSFTCD